MANRAAPALALRDGDREELSRIARSSSVHAGLVQRARSVLAAADGVANEQIASRVRVSKGTVLTWRGRHVEHGLVGLDDAPRSGRPRLVDQRRIVATTLSPPPAKLGVTHWSSRLLGRHLGIGNKTVATAWKEFGVQPWRSETRLVPPGCVDQADIARAE